MRGIGALTVVCLLVSVTPAAAQQNVWGLSASLTPRWESPTGIAPIFRAEAVSVEGSDLQVGIVRGRSLGGDWGVSFIRKQVTAGGIIERDGNRDVVDEGVEMTGATLDYFGVFTTIGNRVQIGVVSAFGAASITGTARRNNTETVEFREALTPLGYSWKVSPVARVELAVAVIATRQLKLRVSSGFSYPGVSRITVGGVFLFER